MGIPSGDWKWQQIHCRETAEVGKVCPLRGKQRWELSSTCSECNKELPSCVGVSSGNKRATVEEGIREFVLGNTTK